MLTRLAVQRFELRPRRRARFARQHGEELIPVE